ncbi:benzoate 4-monooxygenase cytochrome P450 [Lasiosphaeria miniovina]|uniref:Benzoate 4-monooxygenase cytochrome P450 n=1 Tax=Lasiosphaeria miniovina TaxID=1954250 RepID=A0AA40AJ35_9PEZI|nr:benzoate 4-monooxygenase cytochrome P450 [Lasiosphaeria miniovina]KAK0716747.1 benzoate 4-monooxygenase cytochrome P450 [Lasiosphaeria miniovina]
MAASTLAALGLAGTCLLFTYVLLSLVAGRRRLQHIPGPAWAEWTPLWLVRRQLGGRISRDLAALSKKYGSIYRIAPNWVVVSDPAEVRRVWAARGPWHRGEWYGMFKFNQPVHTIMSLTDNAAHGALRAKLVPGYSGRDVDNLHAVVDRRIADLIALIERNYLSARSGPLRPMDLAQKSQFLTLDIISELAVGQCFECLAHDTDTYGQIAFVTGSVPLMVAMAVVPRSFGLLQHPVVQAVLPQDKMAGVMRMMALAQAKAAERFGPSKKVARDMLGSFVAHGVSPASAWLETFGQIGAGSDTTATAIRMTLFLLLAGSPASYAALQREIDEAVRDGRVSGPITDDEARQLPYLQAVIREGLRVWPPVAGLMPKVCDTEQVVCGKRIPAGTNVCWDAISVLHDKYVFGDDAHCFRPERWLDEEDADKRRAMEQVQMLCFGTSSRWECLGKAIALIELNKIFVELLRRFDFSLVDPLKPFTTYDASLSIQSDLWVRVQART